MSVMSWLHDEPTRKGSLRNLLIFETMRDGRFDLMIEYAKLQFGFYAAQLQLNEAGRAVFSGKINKLDQLDLSVFIAAVPDEGVLVIDDAHADSRFALDPATGMPQLCRFYAGLPLTLRDGTRAGTLSVADWRPRSLAEADIAHLHDLARIVSDDLAMMQRID